MEKPIAITLTVDLTNLPSKVRALKDELIRNGVYEIGSFMVDTIDEIVSKSPIMNYGIEVFDRGGIIDIREKLSLENIGLEIILTRNSMKIRYGNGSQIEITSIYTPCLLLDKYDEIIRFLNIGTTIDNALENIYDAFKDILKEHVSEYLFLSYSLTWAALIFGTLIDGIACIREIDLRSIRSPQTLVWYDHLEHNASNMIPILYRLGRGRLPDNVQRALQVLFENNNVTGFFSLTPEGTVFFKLVIDGLEISPPSIPNGVWRVMTIETALALNPTILLIDEFENSLHARIQEYLLDEIRESGVTAIVTTHSPIPVDYARDLREILILESTGYETRASRLKSIEEYKEKLEKLGLTPSEALLYGFIRD